MAGKAASSKDESLGNSCLINGSAGELKVRVHPTSMFPMTMIQA